MKYSILFLVAILSACASTSDYMISESGKCHAMCTMENDLYESSTTEYIEYTGDNKLEDVKLKEVQISAATTKWEKRKSGDEGSLVWCLVEIPGQYITVLEDTTQSSNWKMTEIKQHELIRKGGYTERTEVVCENDISPRLYTSIKNSLYELGIYKGSRRDDGSWRKEAKTALETYQREEGLPIGYFNIPTLEALEIEY